MLDEARFWGERQTTDPPDHRLRVRAESPQELWEDPEVEAIARGRYVERIIAACSPPGLRVLELACGCGWLSLELARAGHHVRGVDLSEERIRSAQGYASLVRDREPDLGSLEYEVGDLDSLPLPEAAFDRIVCWDGLHHVDAVEVLMRRIHRALRPGGLLLIFDHIGPASDAQERLDQMLALLILILFQPRRVAHFLRSRRNGSRSPSEDRGARKILPAVLEVFGRENVVYDTTLAFGKRWLARLRGPRSLRLAIVRVCCALDRLGIRLGMVRGEYLYLRAVRT